MWWKAVTKHRQGDDFDTEPWELYDLSTDPSECRDLADEQSGRLAGLIESWWREAERHGVLPLDDRLLELFAPHLSARSPHRPDRRYSYRPPMSPIPAQASASVGGRAFDLTARITRAAGDEGVIWATGNENSGVSVFVQDDRLVVDYKSFDHRTIVESTAEVPVGDSTLSVHLERDSRTTGWVEVSVDGEQAGRGEIPFYMRMVSSVGSSVGLDHGSAVSERYDAPFVFSGTLHDVMVQLPSRRGADATNEVAAAERTEMSRQ